MSKQISGIHHVTAIAGDPTQNVAFYEGVLGLRLVKVTVNFDDPGSYHFYYGDSVGTPGTIMTFFTWPGARRGRTGNGQVTVTSFAVPKGSLGYWQDRLKKAGVEVGAIAERFGERVLPFSDPDGMQLELIESAAVTDGVGGFHSTTLAERNADRTAQLLTGTMGFRLVGTEENRSRYEVGDGGVTKTVDLVGSPGGTEGRVAVGSVHHIAWRTPDDAQELEWSGELTKLGYNLSPVMDRVYFHSIYFREPGNVLFEIATDQPGFAVDEPVEKLGTSLRLPRWLEPHRERIEKALPPFREGAAA